MEPGHLWTRGNFALFISYLPIWLHLMQSGNSNYNTTILTRSPLMQFITIQSLGKWQCVQGALIPSTEVFWLCMVKVKSTTKSLLYKQEVLYSPCDLKGKKTLWKLVSTMATSKIGTVFQAFINQIKHMQFKLCFPCHINILMNIHQWVELKIYWRFACLIISVEFCNW